MKFYVRRAIAGLIATPIIAVIYCALFALALGVSHGTSANLADTFHAGLVIGLALATCFTFAPQFAKLIGTQD